MPERDRALQMLRQSDCVTSRDEDRVHTGLAETAAGQCPQSRRPSRYCRVCSWWDVGEEKRARQNFELCLARVTNQCTCLCADENLPRASRILLYQRAR